jgi:hypothetical protein
MIDTGVKGSGTPMDMSAAERARWLAELADALDQAQSLATELGLDRRHDAASLELRGSLASARARVQALRPGKPDGEELDPKWSVSSLWSRDR